jgi:hypothetical protein
MSADSPPTTLEPFGAAWVAPWLDGYHARLDGQPREAGASSDWRKGWDAADLDLAVASYGY